MNLTVLSVNGGYFPINNLIHRSYLLQKQAEWNENVILFIVLSWNDCSFPIEMTAHWFKVLEIIACKED